MRLASTLWTAIVVVAGAESIALLIARPLLLPVSGCALAAAEFLLGREIARRAPEPEPDTTETTLVEQRLARVATLAARADGTRGDWDRHVRPLVSREFELTLGVHAGDRSAAAREIGTGYFGSELWRWVDPANVAGPHGDRDAPGPGRDTLCRIMDRLDGQPVS
ncbi:hypothetical protein ACFYTQ_35855 [Nocardia sp. NPDC004068]|uniref:hypothetical protein n=1 Tax=Nocardia sp. NPDC004068 TaxID=3364303 RepID=UPI00369D0F93